MKNELHLCAFLISNEIKDGKTTLTLTETIKALARGEKIKRKSWNFSRKLYIHAQGDAIVDAHGKEYNDICAYVMSDPWQIYSTEVTPESVANGARRFINKETGIQEEYLGINPFGATGEELITVVYHPPLRPSIEKKTWNEARKVLEIA